MREKNDEAAIAEVIATIEKKFKVVLITDYMVHSCEQHEHLWYHYDKLPGTPLDSIG